MLGESRGESGRILENSSGAYREVPTNSGSAEGCVTEVGDGGRAGEGEVIATIRPNVEFSNFKKMELLEKTTTLKH